MAAMWRGYASLVQRQLAVQRMYHIVCANLSLTGDLHADWAMKMGSMLNTGKVLRAIRQRNIS